MKHPGHAIEVREYVAGTEDELGIPQEGWTAWESQKVFGWGAPQTEEPKTRGHDREVVEIEVLVPPGFPNLSHRAQARLDGDIYDVIGSVENYDHSPFNWNPGGVLNLKRVQEG